MTVVIADDSAMSRKITIRALPPEWEVTIVEASDGRQALAWLRDNAADLMLLDLTMPEMGGNQVLETMRRENLHCPVIVISADVQPLAREKALALGALGFVCKPLKAQALIPVLNESGLL